MEKPMRTHHPFLSSVLVSTAAALAFVALPAHAGQPYQISVKAIHKNEKFEVIGKDEKTGRLVFFGQSRAVDKEVRGKGLWNDSVRVATSRWDMLNGYGTGQGFARTEKGGGAVLVEWTGVCYPVGQADGKPLSYCSGGWFVVPGSGTGPFAGIAGGGVWTGTSNADGTFSEEWNGMLEQ
jgi:hypothetical protein